MQVEALADARARAERLATAAHARLGDGQITASARVYVVYLLEK